VMLEARLSSITRRNSCVAFSLSSVSVLSMEESLDKSLKSYTFQDPNAVQAPSVDMLPITIGTRWKQAGGRV
jgi:hypothetical protein